MMRGGACPSHSVRADADARTRSVVTAPRLNTRVGRTSTSLSASLVRSSGDAIASMISFVSRPVANAAIRDTTDAGESCAKYSVGTSSDIARLTDKVDLPPPGAPAMTTSSFVCSLTILSSPTHGRWSRLPTASGDRIARTSVCIASFHRLKPVGGQSFRRPQPVD